MRKHNLKVVVSNNVTEKKELLIVGEIHRHSQQAEDRNKRFTRRYSQLDTAIPRLTAWMIRDGKVGDVCEIYHNITKLQIGTIKMTSKGKLITNFVWDEE